MATSVDNAAWMEWMTGLMGPASRQTCAATLPPDRFYCLLDELPLHLIPRHASTLLRREADQSLYLNPQCTLCGPGEVPDEFASHKELLAGFALGGTVAWVRDAVTQSVLPFWLGPELESVVRNLRPAEPIPGSVSESAKRLLAAAGILASEDGDNPRSGNHEQKVGESAALFQQKGYAPLADLIHPLHIASLRRYYRYLIRTGAIRLGDRQSPRRYVAYNEPVARFFHHQVAAALSAVAGEALKPSYVYMASYLSGAELKKHTDRAQCEFSVTLCLDFSPEPAVATPWPICLDTPTGIVTVHQALGDGLAYRGTRLPHYRDRLGEGQTSTSIFFHYVAADFEGPLD